MKIIILGAGRVGQSVADSLVSERNDITVIDTDAARLRDLESRFDLRGVVGNGIDGVEMALTTLGNGLLTHPANVALRQKLRPVPLSTISARQGISLSYLEQLFSALRRAGLVDSTSGPGGGYTLARRAEQVSVAEIILAVENLKNDELQNLGAGQAAQVKSMTGELWTSFNSRVMEYLQSVTLQDLAREPDLRNRLAAIAVPVRFRT